MSVVAEKRTRVITIHHLGVSQSDRIVWLMEELELPYELVWYDRQESGLMPPAYEALHPAATAPVIQDGDLVLAESTAIVQYVVERHAGGRLGVAPESPDYPHYLYWLQFNNVAQSAAFTRLAVSGFEEAAKESVVVQAMRRREEALYRYLDARLAASPYLAGSAFTAADVMSAFNLTTLPRFGGRAIDDLPHASAYVDRITNRPAYRKAMAIAGPDATRPATK